MHYQGTVATFDTATGAGTVVNDRGEFREFSPAAFAAGGLLLLRLGQRVRVECDEAGAISCVTIVTMP